MRYELDEKGYIKTVAFGCNTGKCAEYSGTVPAGYNSLVQWSEYAYIKAYYIDNDGNLALDTARLSHCMLQDEKDAVDNALLVRKDLYKTEEIIANQYSTGTVAGNVVVLENIMAIEPKVNITGIQAEDYTKLRLYVSGRNMMPNDAVTQTIAGVEFTKNYDGTIRAIGTATEDIEYVVSGSDTNTAPLFSIKGESYYALRLGGLNCELRLFDGETTLQQYSGPDGILYLPQSIDVTEVVIKISSGEEVYTDFGPQLEYGPLVSDYEPYEGKVIEIDFAEAIKNAQSIGNTLFPSDTLYPGDTLYPNSTMLDYIRLENGIIYASINNIETVVGHDRLGLSEEYNIICASADTSLEIEYCKELLEVDSLEFLQGKSTTTNKFKILLDGSIEAHNGYFSGKIEATSGYFSGTVKADKGRIGGFEVTEKAIYSTAKSSLSSLVSGVYIGTDGISIGGSSGFTVTSEGDITIGLENDISLGGNINFTTAYSYVKCKGINSALFSSKHVDIYQDLYMSYGKKITLNKGNLTMDEGTLSMKDGNLYIGYGNIMGRTDTDYRIKFSPGKTAIMDTNIVIGQNSGSLGFFGTTTGVTRQTVSKITTPSSATASDVANKVNALIDALKKYNLIG